MPKRVEILEEWKSITGNTDLLAGMPAFWLPEGYFEALPVQVSAKISDDPSGEPATLSPLLSALPAPAFTVPGSYFDSLADEVMERIKGETKIRRLSAPRMRLWKYAAAALVTGAIAISAVLFTHRQHQSQSIAGQLARVPENDIEEYLLQYQADIFNRDIIYDDLEDNINLSSAYNAIPASDIRQYLDSQADD